MAMAMGVRGHRSSSSGAVFTSPVWSRGSGVRTRARVRTIPVVEAIKTDGGSGNAKKGEILGRELARSSARSLTICNVAGVSSDSANAEIESKEETGRRLCGPPLRGKPLPFGATACEAGVNFAVHSGGAKAVSLCLFTESDLQQVRALYPSLMFELAIYDSYYSSHLNRR
jgi:hypothetical protein